MPAARRQRGSRRGALGALCLVLAAGCANPTDLIRAPVDPLSPAPDGLYRLRSRDVGAVFVRPGASASAYDSFLFDRVVISYQSRPGLPSPFHSRLGNHLLGPESTRRLQQIVRDAIVRELTERAGLALTYGAGPRVLRVSSRIVDLVWEVPPARDGESFRVLRTGEMTLVVDVRDSETNVLLAHIADRRLIRPNDQSRQSFENRPTNNWAGVRALASAWARILLQSLAALDWNPDLANAGGVTMFPPLEAGP